MAKHKENKTFRAIDRSSDIWLELNHTHEWIIPSAEEMERLEWLTPWITDRFMTMAEKDQDNYLENNRYFFDKITLTIILWQIFTFILIIFITSLAFYMVYKWETWEAVALVLAELIWWISLFVYKKKVDKTLLNSVKNVEKENV